MLNHADNSPLQRGLWRLTIISTVVGLVGWVHVTRTSCASGNALPLCYMSVPDALVHAVGQPLVKVCGLHACHVTINHGVGDVLTPSDTHGPMLHLPIHRLYWCQFLLCFHSFTTSTPRSYTDALPHLPPAENKSFALCFIWSPFPGTLWLVFKA